MLWQSGLLVYLCGRLLPLLGGLFADCSFEIFEGVIILRVTKPIVVTLWGDFALFTRLECKVERMTYPVPTPSAIRGVLSAIYSKPVEFYWQVDKIEVLRPIKYASCMRNEVKNKMGRLSEKDPLRACIYIEDSRTQRQSIVLKDVKYRVTAHMVLRDDFQGTPAQLYKQFERRCSVGQCFMQPCLGTREFVCYYEWGSDEELPIDESLDIGYMVYDVFDLDNHSVHSGPSVSLFYGRMERGVVEVPEFHSPQVLRPGKEAR